MVPNIRPDFGNMGFNMSIRHRSVITRTSIFRSMRKKFMNSDFKIFGKSLVRLDDSNEPFTHAYWSRQGYDLVNKTFTLIRLYGIMSSYIKILGFLRFRRQLLTSCNVETSFFNDWFSGHLNFQIEHHLFPTMPRHNLHKIAPYVKSMCDKHKITYELKTLGRAMADIY